MTSERPEDELEPKDDEGELQSADDESAELDEDEGGDEDEGLDDEPRSSAPAAPVSSKGMAQVRGPEPRHRGSESPRIAVSDEDELPYVDDRFSRYWVGAIVAVFLLILAYGILFGKAGELTPPTPSPTPSPSATPTLSASPVPSSSLTPAPSITITPLPSSSAVSPTAPPSPTPAPSS